MEISVKGLLFDYGGTIDTNGIHWGVVVRRACERFGLRVERDRFREAYVSVERTLGSLPVIRPEHTFRETLHIKMRLLFDILGINTPSLSGKIADACYADTRLTTLRAKKVLEELKRRYPIVLVSNFYGNLRTVLREFCLDGYFLRVIESAEAGIRKPDPALYASAVEILGLPPCEVAIIGDSYRNDIQPALLLGCPSIWLKGKGWDERDEAIEHPCIITDFTDLRTLLA